MREPRATLKRSMTRLDAASIVRKLIELAKAGDLQAMKLIFERMDSAEVERRLDELERAVFRSIETRGVRDYGNRRLKA